LFLVSPGQLGWLVVVLLAALLWRVGFFTPVAVSIGQLPAIRVALQHRRGAYRLSGKAFEEARKLVPPEARLVGLYYDDPKEGRPEAELRYSAGAVLEGEGVETDPKEWAAMGYEVVELPTARAATCTFPFRGTLSIILAGTRVYPALADFMARSADERAAGAVVEVYDGLRGAVDYFVPLEGSFLLHRERGSTNGDGPGGAGPPPAPAAKKAQ